MTLYRSYNAVDPELVSPKLRGNMESYIAHVEKGQKNFLDVLEEMIILFRNKFIHFKNNIHKLDTELNKQFKVM